MVLKPFEPTQLFLSRPFLPHLLEYVQCQESCLARLKEVAAKFESDVMQYRRQAVMALTTTVGWEQFRDFFPPFQGRPKLLRRFPFFTLFFCRVAFLIGTLSADIHSVEEVCRRPATLIHAEYLLIRNSNNKFLHEVFYDAIKDLEYETTHNLIQPKEFSNSLSVSRRNIAKDVVDPMKKYIRVWVLVHSSSLYTGWKQNTKKGLYEAEVYIMNNKQIFQVQKKTKGALPLATFPPSPFPSSPSFLIV